MGTIVNAIFLYALTVLFHIALKCVQLKQFEICLDYGLVPNRWQAITEINIANQLCRFTDAEIVYPNELKRYCARYKGMEIEKLSLMQ